MLCGKQYRGTLEKALFILLGVLQRFPIEFDVLLLNVVALLCLVPQSFFHVPIGFVPKKRYLLFWGTSENQLCAENRSFTFGMDWRERTFRGLEQGCPHNHTLPVHREFLLGEKYGGLQQSHSSADCPLWNVESHVVFTSKFSDLLCVSPAVFFKIWLMLIFFIVCKGFPIQLRHQRAVLWITSCANSMHPSSLLKVMCAATSSLPGFTSCRVTHGLPANAGRWMSQDSPPCQKRTCFFMLCTQCVCSTIFVGTLKPSFNELCFWWRFHWKSVWTDAQSQPASAHSQMHRALFNAGAADMVSCCQLIFGWKSEETWENLVPTRMHETHCEILEILHV